MSGVRLSLATMRTVFPGAPDTIISAFVEKQGVFSAVGLDQTRQRLAYCFANLHAETGGFTIKNLTEDINYAVARMAVVWPNRFASAAAVQAKYGTAAGWPLKAFDDIYGNRMGNRLGTSDGSRFIGRGGPQITGRDGYAKIGKRIGVDLVSAPDLACNHALQPGIAAAFWDWKGMTSLPTPATSSAALRRGTAGRTVLPSGRRNWRASQRSCKAQSGARWRMRRPSRRTRQRSNLGRLTPFQHRPFHRRPLGRLFSWPLLASSSEV